MSTIRIARAKHTPEVILDHETKEFIIAGYSRPEDAEDFYSDIIRWVSDNVEELLKLDSFDLIIDLEYYNSSSAKELLSLFMKIESLLAHKAVIHWYYEEDDDELEEAGHEMAEILSLDFVFHEKESD